MKARRRPGLRPRRLHQVLPFPLGDRRAHRLHPPLQKGLTLHLSPATVVGKRLPAVLSTQRAAAAAAEVILLPVGTIPAMSRGWVIPATTKLVAARVRTPAGMTSDQQGPVAVVTE